MLKELFLLVTLLALFADARPQPSTNAVELRGKFDIEDEEDGVLFASEDDTLDDMIITYLAARSAEDVKPQIVSIHDVTVHIVPYLIRGHHGYYYEQYRCKNTFVLTDYTEGIFWTPYNYCCCFRICRDYSFIRTLLNGDGDYTEEFATYRIDTGVPGHDNQPVFLRKHLASLRVLAL
ncbi:hypothetical protein EMCRGX_G003413 [Ephydatia muelleri]